MRILITLCVLCLFSSPQVGLKQSGDSGQTKKTTADRQKATQPAVNSTPAAAIPNTASIDKPAPGANQPDRAKEEKPKHDLIDQVNSLSTAVIAAFTVLMFVVMRRQDRSTKIAERAWVVSDLDSPEQTESPDIFQARCKMWNKGRTPAWVTKMGSCGQFVKSEKDLPDIPKYTVAGPFTPKGSVLPPGAFSQTAIPIKAGQLQQVARGEITLYFLGFVQYRDVFGEKHETKYCYQLKQSQDLTDPTLEFYIAGPDRFNAAN